MRLLVFALALASANASVFDSFGRDTQTTFLETGSEWFIQSISKVPDAHDGAETIAQFSEDEVKSLKKVKPIQYNDVEKSDGASWSKFEKQLSKNMEKMVLAYRGDTFESRHCHYDNQVLESKKEEFKAPGCSVKAERMTGADKRAKFFALAKKFAPVFYINKEEKYLPTDPDWFLKNSKEVKGKVQSKEATYHALFENEKQTTRSFTGNVNNEGSFNSVDGKKRAPVTVDLYTRDDTVIAKLHVFFAYHGRNSLNLRLKSKYGDISVLNFLNISPIGDHEGDWQELDMHINKKTELLTGVTYWDRGRPFFYPTSKLSLVGGRPTAFIAKGTHTLYPKAGTYPLISGFMHCFSHAKHYYMGLDASSVTAKSAADAITWDAQSDLVLATRASDEGADKASIKSWLVQSHYWGEISTAYTDKHACDGKGRNALRDDLRNRLRKTSSYVSAQVRNTFSELVMVFVCDNMHIGLSYNLGRGRSPITPTTDQSQDASNAELSKFCPKVDTNASASFVSTIEEEQKEEEEEKTEETETVLRFRM